MDIHERQSSWPSVIWTSLRFSTVAVCLLGVIGNVSSMVVLKRKINDIAGSRVLLALAVADLGVVSSIAARTLAYVAYGYIRLTRILEWCFLYFYYCSIYLTVFLSLDRYLYTAKSMLLIRINYKRIVNRVTCGIFAVALLISLPHLVGNFVRYLQGQHFVSITECPGQLKVLCDVNETRMVSRAEKARIKNQHCPATHHADASLRHYLLREFCAVAQDQNFTSACEYQPVRVKAARFVPLVVASIVSVTPLEIDICDRMAEAMRHDPDFVLTTYIGVDIPMRYVIPCSILAVVNVKLVLAVRRAQRRHAEIAKAAVTSLIKLPVLKSVLAIVLVFLVCHTGGLGIFILDLLRTFAGNSHRGSPYGSTIQTYLKEDLATAGLTTRCMAFLLSAINSTVNIVIYCFFLPIFRRHWRELFLIKLPRIKKSKKEPPQDMIPMDEIYHISFSGAESAQCPIHNNKMEVCCYMFFCLLKCKKLTKQLIYHIKFLNSKYTNRWTKWPETKTD